MLGVWLSFPYGGLNYRLNGEKLWVAQETDTDMSKNES